MKTKSVLLFLVIVLIFSGCAAAPSDTTELDQLRQQNQSLSQQLLTAQEQINALSTRIVELENAAPTPQPAEFSFEGLAAQILPLIQSQNFTALAPFIHPELGVRFSPYAYVNLEHDKVFTREQVASFGGDQNVYLWGTQAGSGFDISLTIPEYWSEYVSSQTPAQEWGLLLDPNRKASNSIDNFMEAYPEGHYVDYFQPGTEMYSYMDWKSLRLGFQQSSDGMYYLMAIIHDEWTP